MDQYQIIDNLIDLYSDDEELRLEALMAKKEWIIDRFYVPFSIKPAIEGEYSDLQALKMLSLPFHKMNTTGVLTTTQKSMAEKFNSKFRRLRLYEHLPERPHKHIFYVQVNFHHLDRDDYKVLVANFYYCLLSSVLDSTVFPSDIRKVFAYAVEGEEDEAMLIVDDKYLNRNVFKVDGFTKIYLYDDLTKEEIASIKDIAKYLRLPVVNVHVGNK